MSIYTAPLRDMLFTMKEVGGLDAICAQPGHDETTPELVEAILQEAARYAIRETDADHDEEHRESPIREHLESDGTQESGEDVQA